MSQQQQQGAKKSGDAKKATDAVVGNMTSQLQTKINLAAGGMDPSWKTAGKKPGLQIWRVEAFRLVAVPEAEHGTFSSANVYMVLKTSAKDNGLRWDAHFWLGADATAEDAYTASAKIADLDDIVGGSPSQSREFQGNESSLFLSHFPAIKVTLPGGGAVAGGNKKNRMFRIKGPRGGATLTEVQPVCASLNSGDVFILDSPGWVTVWHGSGCNPTERSKAGEVASALANSRNPPSRTAFFEEANEAPPEFWAMVGGKGQIAPAAAAGEDEQVASTKRLFRLTDGVAGAGGSDASASLAPTVVPVANFNPTNDAKDLRKAVKGLGTDERVLIEIIGGRTNEQRQAIRRAYKQEFNRDLIKDVEDDTSFNFKAMLSGLLRSPHAYDAACLREAIKGLGTDEACLVEILCNRNNAEINNIIAKYRADFDRDLANDIIGDTSGDFKRFLVEILKAGRDESSPPDREGALTDVKMLYKAGEGRWGTDEAKFIEILTRRSRPHLKLVFEEYHKQYKRTIFQAIESETSGDFKAGLLAIAQCSVDPVPYFSERLFKSMKGMGTDDKALMRIVISRSEVDLQKIKEHFALAHPEMPLTDRIIDDTSGDYKKLLLKVVGPEVKKAVAGASAAPTLFMADTGAQRITRNLFASDDVFVFDAGIAVFAWVGRGASSLERRTALQYAQNYLIAYNRPTMTPIMRISEGSEPDLFFACLDQQQ